MTFQVTDKAAERIRTICQKDGRDDLFLRISVSGGGCQGFQYDMTLDDHKAEGDTVTANGDASVVIDEVSLPFIDGACLDWITDLTGECFRIINPNASSSCGCGTSFAV